MDCVIPVNEPRNSVELFKSIADHDESDDEEGVVEQWAVCFAVFFGGKVFKSVRESPGFKATLDYLHVEEDELLYDWFVHAESAWISLVLYKDDEDHLHVEMSFDERGLVDVMKAALVDEMGFELDDANHEYVRRENIPLDLFAKHIPSV